MKFFIDINCLNIIWIRIVDVDAIHIRSNHKDGLIKVGVEESWLSRHLQIIFEFVNDYDLLCHKIERKNFILFGKYDFTPFFDVFIFDIFKMEVHASFIELIHIFKDHMGALLKLDSIFIFIFIFVIILAVNKELIDLLLIAN